MSAGNSGRPAASPEVQPAGRRALEFRSKRATTDTTHGGVSLVRRPIQLSQMVPLPGITVMVWRSPDSLEVCHWLLVSPAGRPLGHDSTGRIPGYGTVEISSVPA